MPWFSTAAKWRSISGFMTESFPLWPVFWTVECHNNTAGQNEWQNALQGRSVHLEETVHKCGTIQVNEHQEINYVQFQVFSTKVQVCLQLSL